MIAYPVILAKDEDTVLVTSRDFPELVTFGMTKAETLDYAVGALREAIAARIAYREELPLPSASRRGEIMVELPAQTALKFLLYRNMREQGMRKADMARKIGVHKQEMDRIFNVGHATSLAKLQRAFAVLGKKLDISVVDAQS